MITKPFQDISLSRLGMGNMRLPVEGGKEESRLREILMAEVNRLELGCAYRYEDSMARAILTGAPAALGELLVRLG